MDDLTRERFACNGWWSRNAESGEGPSTLLVPASERVPSIEPDPPSVTAKRRRVLERHADPEE